ncbi:MAG: L,D-transpeptidase [Bdellovibrionota bacterium]
MTFEINKKAWLPISMALVASVLTACSQPNAENISPLDGPVNTGADDIEAQTGVLAAANLKVGFQAFVSSERVRVRATPEVSDSNLLGVLELNDKVEIVDPARQGSQDFVKVKVVSSSAGIASGTIAYMSANYLNDSPAKPQGASGEAVNTTIIVNVANDKVRVYKKCAPGEGCVNRMVIQQDVVNGQNDGGTRTDLGVYRITSWVKFYETMPKYAAWYKEGYPAPPAPGADRTKWLGNKKYSVGSQMRGAFGWYTLHVGPNNNGQWMHGTAGWGADKKDFILFRHSFMGQLVGLFASIDSHGCTRVDNESIAFIRSIAPVGTRYLKVYAKEGVRDANRSGYSKEKKRFDYIITKNGAQVTNNHELANREIVLANGTPRDRWIEEGTLEYSAYPNPVPFKAKGGTKGSDRYKIGAGPMSGVFLVDEGTFVDYQHPRHDKVSIGGLYDGGRPSALPSNHVSQDRNFTILDNEWQKN